MGEVNGDFDAMVRIDDVPIKEEEEVEVERLKLSGGVSVGESDMVELGGKESEELERVEVGVVLELTEMVNDEGEVERLVLELATMVVVMVLE